MSKMSDIDLENEETKKALENEMILELISEAKHHSFTTTEIQICRDINTLVFVAENPISAKQIQAQLPYHYDVAQIRKVIQLVRRHNSMFNDDGCFLIAVATGYKMSTDYNEIKGYFEKTQHRYENTTPQLLQMRKTLSYLEKEN